MHSQSLKIFTDSALLLALLGCADNYRVVQSKSRRANEANAKQPTYSGIQIAIQPFDDFPVERAEAVLNGLKSVYGNTVLLFPTALPRKAYYPARNRYRADTIIDWLSELANGNQVIVGLTTKDISASKGEYADWGIMGLGQCPGNSCVVSSFRLKNLCDSQLFKVVIHELGHTQGLEHCPVESCFMRDAEGRNTTDEEFDFCPACKKRLRSKGWKL